MFNMDLLDMSLDCCHLLIAFLFYHKFSDLKWLLYSLYKMGVIFGVIVSNYLNDFGKIFNFLIKLFSSFQTYIRIDRLLKLSQSVVLFIRVVRVAL